MIVLVVCVCVPVRVCGAVRACVCFTPRNVAFSSASRVKIVHNNFKQLTKFETRLKKYQYCESVSLTSKDLYSATTIPNYSD